MSPIQFWSLVDRSGSDSACWMWLGAFDKSTGYGYYCVGKKKEAAHRAAYMYGHQSEIGAGLQVRHSCDTPKCCNPSHLSVGTFRQNMQDKLDRQRQPMGSGHYGAKLNEATVAQIKELLRCPDLCPTHQQMADWLQVSRLTITDIAAGRTWKHVD